MEITMGHPSIQVEFFLVVMPCGVMGYQWRHNPEELKSLPP